MDLNRYDLGKLNSATKYPSIPTYHATDKGLIGEERVAFEGEVVVTEKIDGTNGRIVLLGDDYLIGSREEFLYARGDCIGDRTNGIVDALKPIAERLVMRSATWSLAAIFGEVYGGNIGPAKNYTANRATGFRVFDVVAFSLLPSLEVLDWDREKIASWREHGGQPFISEEGLWAFTDTYGLELVPPIATVSGADLPTSHEETLAWIHRVASETKAALDEGAQHKRPEGVVLRTPDRKTIAKVRYEDYERVLRVRGKGK